MLMRYVTLATGSVRLRGVHRILAGLSGAVVGVGAYALLVEPRRLVVRRAEIAPAGWPRERDGLTLALVSDLHTGAPGVDLDRVVRRVRALDFDVAVLLGDYVDPKVAGGGWVAPERVAAALARIERPKVAVIGNHDHDTDGPRVARALADAGITVLDNAACEIGGVWFAGVDDASLGTPDPHRALRDVPPGAPVVGLSHDPDVFPALHVPLTLSGHSHGGQLRIPLLRRAVTPARFHRGLYRHHDELLYVTSGIGTSRWPVRLGLPPEIVLLRLRASSRLTPAGIALRSPHGSAPPGV